MAKQSDFNEFLSNIEPSESTVKYISSVQNNLRTYLKTHEKYKEIHIDTFLSGSYAKHTSIRPVLGDSKRDVDIIVITTYSADTNSVDVLEELRDVLIEKDLYKSAKLQSHSVGIELKGIDIDVVPVIVDSEDDQLFFIGDSDKNNWTKTDPKGHKSWSAKVNKNNNEKYKPLVKILKWWRRVNCPENSKYPKGITLEKIIADNLGDSSLSTEDFLIATIQNIISKYKENYVDNNKNPVICDPSDKIKNNDLLLGYSTSDFSSFISKLSDHIDLHSSEGTSNVIWQKVLGTEFPNESNNSNIIKSECLKNCLNASHRKQPIWPMQRGGVAFVSLKVLSTFGDVIEYQNNDFHLDKGCSLHFKALTGIKPPFKVFWQIVNTGYEAMNEHCLRGGFEESNEGASGRREITKYSGSHFVQCFIIKHGYCVAKSKEFFINIK